MQSTFLNATVLEEFVCQQLLFQLCANSYSVRTAFVNGYARKLEYIKTNQGVCLGFETNFQERTGEAVRVDNGDNTDTICTPNLYQELFLPIFGMKWAQLQFAMVRCEHCQRKGVVRLRRFQCLNGDMLSYVECRFRRGMFPEKFVG